MTDSLPAQCIHCGSPRVRLHGYIRKTGRRRFRCHHCWVTFSEARPGSDSPFYGMRTSDEKCWAFINLLKNGHTLRGAAAVIGVNNNTATKILALSRHKRLCENCGSAIPKGNRFRFCSDECQFWRAGIGGALACTAAALKELQQSGDGSPESLAMTFAQEISAVHAAEYLGPCFEAIAEALSEGVTDTLELRRRTRKFVRKMWNETMSFAAHLDAMKDASGFEPHQHRPSWAHVI